MSPITELIRQANAGSSEAANQLFESLYADLRRIAHAKLRHGRNPTLLDTTSLVHECWLRLEKLDSLAPQSRGHYLAYAARVMRSVVVDMVRESQAVRHGGGLARVTLDTAVSDALPAGDEQILAVHEVLEELAQVDERLVRVVEMRYFVGLSMDEIAQALDVGKRTVERDWEKARSFLYARLNSA